MEITAADICAFGNDERDLVKVRHCRGYLEQLLPAGEAVHAFFISKHGGYSEDLFFFTGSFLVKFPEYHKAVPRGITQCHLYSLTYSVIGLNLDAQEKTDVLPRSLTVEITMKDMENIRMSASGANTSRLETIVRDCLIPHLRR